MARILFVLTSQDRLLDGEPSGLWLPDLAIPALLLREAGHELRLASTAGGAVPLDPCSVPREGERPAWDPVLAWLEATEEVARVAERDFDAVVVCGGRGALFDFPFHRRLHHLLFRQAERGGLTVTIGHGAAVFVGMRTRAGIPHVSGRQLACVTEAEEQRAGGTIKIPLLLERRLRELGAFHSRRPPGEVHAVRDRELISAQNPASAQRAGEILVHALKQRCPGARPHDPADSVHPAVQVVRTSPSA